MTLEQLRNDEAQLLAQIHQLQGALGYVRGKIAAAEKEAAKAKDAKKAKKNGTAPEPTEAPVEAQPTEA